MNDNQFMGSRSRRLPERALEDPRGPCQDAEEVALRG